jgi:hypothetical protein
MNSGSGCLNVIVSIFLPFVLQRTTKYSTIKELTAAGTVQDSHLFPLQIIPDWNYFTRMWGKCNQKNIVKQSNPTMNFSS